MVQYMEEKGDERVYFGFADEAGQEPIGFALVGAKYGYGSDPIKLAFGYDALSGRGHRPQGPRAQGDPRHRHQDRDGSVLRGPLLAAGRRGVRPRLASRRSRGAETTSSTRSDAHQVDMISGATISSKAVIAIVNEAVAGDLGEWLATYMKDAAAGNTASEGAR